MRFHETENVIYECVYDDETEKEYTRLYDLLPILKKFALENHNLSKLLCRIYSEYEEHTGTLLKDDGDSHYKFCDASTIGMDCLKCQIAETIIKAEEL